MKIYKNIGSKERLFEMMERVNKIDVNEYMSTNNLNSKSVLEFAFDELASKKLKVKQSNIQTNDENTYVELLCLDNNGNNITFVFKSNATEGEQDGVYNVNNVTLASFTFDDASTGESVELNEDDLKEFNAKYSNQLFDVVDDYLDYESPEPEIDEEYENAIRKIDSYEPKTNENNINFAELGTDKQITKLDPQQKQYVIITALHNVNDRLENMGMSHADLTHDEFRQQIKDEAIRLFQEYLTTGNEGGSLNEKKDGTDYPDPIGQKFKSKSKYPKPKKKPIKTVNIDENEPSTPQEYAFQKKYGDDWKELDSIHEDDNVGQNDDNNEPDTKYSEPEVKELEDEKEKVGDVLGGGLGDDKSPKEFDTQQIVMGVQVELEHTNDPMIAMEIAIDHLTEIPDYYTRLKKMEDNAENEINGSEESDKSEEEMEDILLGYEPKNVGDEMDEELIDYQDDLIKDLPDITKIEVPVGLGKTGSIKKPKEI